MPFGPVQIFMIFDRLDEMIRSWLFSMVHRFLTIYWIQSENVHAHLRVLVKHILRKQMAPTDHLGLFGRKF